MDAESKTYLDDSFTRWSQHIVNELSSRFNETNQRVESIDSSLKLEAGLIQSGANAVARFSEFAETSEQRWVSLVHHVDVIERRLDAR